MHGSLDPEENVMNDNRFTQDDLWQTMSDLGWDVRRDEIGAAHDAHIGRAHAIWYQHHTTEVFDDATAM